jgi:ribosome-associated protein
MPDVNDSLRIPDSELTFQTSRSSGPGGQHVNKTETRVTLLFDVAGSPSLSEEQRRILFSRLATRINRDGVLRVVSQQYRSQDANREAAVARFVELLRVSLKRRTPRVRTRATLASKARRLQAKKERGAVKRHRGTPTHDD